MRFLKSKTFWFSAISVAIVIAIFRYLFQHISPSDVVEVIRNVDRRALLVFVLLSITMSIFRTWRYRLLLSLSGHTPPIIPLFLTVLARNCTSDLLPARLGTLTYVFLATTRLGVPLGPATSSFGLAMLFDVVGLAPLVLVSAFFAGAQSYIPTWMLVIGSLVLAAIPIIALYLFSYMISVFNRVLKSTTFFVGRREDITATLNQINQDLARSKESKVFAPLLILSVLIRVTKYAALYFFLYGLLVSFGYTLAELNPAKAFLGICASELSASLPISGIAGFGLYQGTWSVVFEFLGFPGDIAKLTSISHHLFTQAYGYGLGLVAFLLLLMPFFKVKEEKAHKSSLTTSLRYFYARSIALSISVVMIVAVILGGRESVAESTKTTSHYSPPSDAKRPPLEGEIVFDSNRSGSFGIYILSTPSLEIKTLIDTAQHEMYPDPSPNGDLIVYSRAISTSRLAPSAIWLYERATGNTKKLNDDGAAPHFSADGKTIYFERNRRKVMAMDIDGTNVREIFPLDRKSMRGYQVVKPKVSPDGSKVAFSSDKKGAWNAWAADLKLKKLYHIHKGCEPTWVPNTENIAWIIKSGARQGSGIFTKELSAPSHSELQDSGEPLGHEYFPTFSADGKWLLYGAAPPDNHSHIEDDYNLMIKNLDSGEIYQLTFDKFTDRWPKLIAK